MPTHCHNEITRNVAWTHLEMGLDGHEVVGDSVGHGSLHDVREKLEEWEIVVSQPRHQPAVIGGTQALVVAHGPMALLANAYAE